MHESARSTLQDHAGRIVATLVVILALVCGTLHSASAADGATGIHVREVARGLVVPWAIAFLPDGRFLVTERPGRLRIISPAGELSAPIANVPAVHAEGQGGLLDVVLAPDFRTSREVFLSFAQPTARGARTAVARAILDADALALRDLRIIFAQREDPDGGHHWGARLAFGHDGTLFVTLGDRFYFRDRAQDLGSHLGKVVRIRRDGTVPPDNPFVGKKGALPEIWSYGHRNVQGAAVHPDTGFLWTHEHGPQGGDELNVDRAGRNYGWPLVTQGREYVSGARIGEGESRPDVEVAVRTWVPSIAPSGMAFCTSDAYPGWRGSVLIGALRAQMLVRLVLDGERVLREERLFAELGARIRDVRQGPDGLIYLLDETQGRVLRLDPA